MKHTILGAGGSIGNALTDTLLKKGEMVKLVSRSNHAIEGAQSTRGDLMSYADTAEAVKQSDIVYLCAGLHYDIKIWEENWPKIMRNTINACKEAGAKLIFFDNVYMYGKVSGNMTEQTPYHPTSKKGEVRARIANMLEEEIAKGHINAIIARAADLYGPYGTNATSIPHMMVFDPLMRGKRAQWLANVNQPHSYTYIPDCANGLYLLANDDTAWNQVWHLPISSPAIDGKTFIRIAADVLGEEAKYRVLTKVMMRMAKPFSKIASESFEMLYQNELPYHFDSLKFNSHFQYTPVSYEEGIKNTIDWLKQA